MPGEERVEGARAPLDGFEAAPSLVRRRSDMMGRVWARIMVWALMALAGGVFVLFREDDRPWILVLCTVSIIALGAGVISFGPWRIMDRLLAGLLGSLVPGFSEDAWVRSSGDRLRIAKIFWFGLVLVALFPFCQLWRLLPNLELGFFIPEFLAGLAPADGYASPSHHPYELWEVAVCFWSVVFMFWVVIWHAVDHMDRVQVSTKVAYGWGLAVAVGFIAFCIVVFVLLIVIRSAVGRVAAEIMIVTGFCVFDVVLYRMYKKRASRETDVDIQRMFERRAPNFLRFLILVDLPALVGFIFLMAYLHHGNLVSEWNLSFISGAAAFSLIVVNMVYSVQYAFEVYQDVLGVS